MSTRTILVNDAQLELIERAIEAATLQAPESFSAEQREELALLQGMARRTRTDRPDSDLIHGWTL